MEVDFSYPLQTSIAEWYPKKPAESVRHNFIEMCVERESKTISFSILLYTSIFSVLRQWWQIKIVTFFFKKIDSDYETDYETDPPTSPSPYPSPYPNIEPNQSRQQYTLHRNRRDIIGHIERVAAQYVTEQWWVLWFTLIDPKWFVAMDSTLRAVYFGSFARLTTICCLKDSHFFRMFYESYLRKWNLNGNVEMKLLY